MTITHAPKNPNEFQRKILAINKAYQVRLYPSKWFILETASIEVYTDLVSGGNKQVSEDFFLKKLKENMTNTVVLTQRYRGIITKRGILTAIGTITLLDLQNLLKELTKKKIVYKLDKKLTEVQEEILHYFVGAASNNAHKLYFDPEYQNFHRTTKEKSVALPFSKYLERVMGVINEVEGYGNRIEILGYSVHTRVKSKTFSIGCQDDIPLSRVKELIKSLKALQ